MANLCLQLGCAVLLIRIGISILPLFLAGCMSGVGLHQAAFEYKRNTDHAEYENDAIVDEVYTFASPPLTRQLELTNGQSSDGLFTGFRVWSRSVDGQPDPVAQARLQFLHIRQTTLEFKVEGESAETVEIDSFDTPIWQGAITQTDFTPESTKVPSGLPCLNFKRCHVDYYYFDYASVGFPDLAVYHRMCKDTEFRWSHEAISLEARKVGYRVVAHATVTANKGKDEDHVLLYQQENSLSCVMAIEGSDSTLPDWVSNFNVATREWCGFGKVHLGLHEEAMNLVTHESYVTNIKAKLPQCAKVTITGHSKGGGLTNLIAACINRASVPPTAKTAYEAVTWKKGYPELMPAITW